MARLPFRTSVALAAVCAAVPMAAAVPAHAQQPGLLPGTCQEVHERIPIAPDGNYLLTGGGRLFTVYCAGMKSAPSEYITLAKTGQAANFSQYTAGGASPGTNVRTAFTRLRIDPAAFTVDIGDLTYASSTGSLSHAGSDTVASMPYGVAMSCTGAPDGLANIDLQGTAVRVDNPFGLGGAGATGTATVSPSGQVADLTGGGFCGWNMPTPVRYNPYNPSPGMPNLKLACAKPSIVGTSLCVDLGTAAGSTPRIERHGDRRAVRLRPGTRPIAVLDAYGRVASAN
jgi:hypothetical protein